MLSCAATKTWDPIDDIYTRDPGQLSFSELYHFHYRMSISIRAQTYYASIHDRISWMENEFLWNGFYRKWRNDPHRAWPPDFFFNFLCDSLHLRRQMCEDVLRFPSRNHLVIPARFKSIEQVFSSFLEQAKATHDAFHTARRVLLHSTILPIETVDLILGFLF